MVEMSIPTIEYKILLELGVSEEDLKELWKSINESQQSTLNKPDTT